MISPSYNPRALERVGPAPDLNLNLTPLQRPAHHRRLLLKPDWRAGSGGWSRSFAFAQLNTPSRGHTLALCDAEPCTINGHRVGHRHAKLGKQGNPTCQERTVNERCYTRLATRRVAQPTAHSRTPLALNNTDRQAKPPSRRTRVRAAAGNRPIGQHPTRQGIPDS